uniref:Uncharacterized protein n=1 Tax=Anopheles atroparvus TaxID=41427 RepID=A0A182IK96_ANOAO
MEDPVAVAQTRFEPAGGHDADDSLELACHNSADHDQPAQGRGADRLFNLVPLAVKALQSFSGPEMERTQENKDHSWVLPPFVDNIHVMWNQFTQSKLAGALWTKLGLLNVFKGFHGKLYYDYSSCCITNRSTALDQNGHDLPSRTVVNYGKDLLKLGQAKQFLQQYNVTEMTDKLTDTLNLEVIERCIVSTDRQSHDQLARPAQEAPEAASSTV